MDSRTIRVLKGSVQLAGVLHRAGEVFPVPEDVFQWLQGKRSPTLRFEEVGAAAPAQNLQDGKQDDEHDDKDVQDSQQGQDETATHTGEGEDVAGEEEVAATAGASVPAPAPAAPPAPSPLPLASVDAVVAAGLVAAGWDTVEKLKTATQTDLVKVKGIGMTRARAILDEVAGL